jgi:thiamine biosynthesis lipoprotein
VDGQERHHLIDPHTGRPAASGLTAAVVVADEAWWAEGVAKAALIAGPVEGSLMVDRLARGGWLIRDDRSVTVAGRVHIGRVA